MCGILKCCNRKKTAWFAWILRICRRTFILRRDPRCIGLRPNWGILSVTRLGQDVVGPRGDQDREVATSETYVENYQASQIWINWTFKYLVFVMLWQDKMKWSETRDEMPRPFGPRPRCTGPRPRWGQDLEHFFQDETLTPSGLRDRDHIPVEYINRFLVHIVLAVTLFVKKIRICILT